jgi:hypothetical protein
LQQQTGALAWAQDIQLSGADAPSQQLVKLNPRRKLQQALRRSRNGRKQHRLLHLIWHPKVKPNRSMHLRRQSIHLTKVRHRPSFLSKQQSPLLKVKY